MNDQNPWIAWAEMVKDVVVLAGMSYLYFERGVSGWWWVAAFLVVGMGYRRRR